MTDPTGCTWCRKPGHAEADHPLPRDHADYDAFYDAGDDELGAIFAGTAGMALTETDQPDLDRERVFDELVALGQELNPPAAS